METITFHDQNQIPDDLFVVATIAARYNGKWIYCRHKERTTWETPAGHREIGESILDTARRELYEETGAVDFELKPVCAYSLSEHENYGMVYIAEVKKLGKLLEEFEMSEIKLFDALPKNLTYPEIQPELFEKVRNS